jgi:NADPH:quinone reductase-like Zn-dependent oxidoreductase
MAKPRELQEPKPDVLDLARAMTVDTSLTPVAAMLEDTEED